MNWDDLRVFLAMAHAGTTTDAADRLGINQSTVSRRLKQLEADAGVALFARRARGLMLTDAGKEMLEHAEDISSRFASLGRGLVGRDVKLAGTIRVSVGDFLVEPLTPAIAEFGRRYPDIVVEVAVSSDIVSLERSEADIIFRLSRDVPDHLFGRRIAKAGLAIYGTEAHLEQRDRVGLEGLDWIRWAQRWAGIPPEVWIDANIPPGRCRARIDSGLAARELIAAGLGVGFQLCRTADLDPRLRRLSEPLDFGMSLWLLTHPDLRRTARIKAMMSFVGDALIAQRTRFERAR
jgi:DNA-binding transcriptional LysR family regulator